MASATALVADLGPGAATIIVALLGIAATIAARLAPKTRSEAGVDRATARAADAQAWEKLITQQRAELDRLQRRVDAAEEKADLAHVALDEERELCDAQIKQLTDRILVLEAARPTRVWFRE